MCHWTADECLRSYAYWASRCREIADGPLGRECESYRAALQMSIRWLGRYDVLSAAA